MATFAGNKQSGTARVCRAARKCPHSKKNYRVEVSSSGFDKPFLVATFRCCESCAAPSNIQRRLHRNGGVVVSIREVT